MASGTTINQMIDVVTPAAGESVTEGTILEWHVKVGDFIKVDATIVEISTDKVDVELPSPASGTVTEILVEEGDTVTVGQVIARIAIAEGNGAAPSQSEQANGTATGSASATGPSDGEAAPAAQVVDVVTPAAGESVSEGTILEWHVAVGDFIKADATIVEISTDKVDVELPAPVSGTVVELLVAEGETVTVGQVIARIAAGTAEGAREAPAGSREATATAASAEESASAGGSASAAASASGVPENLKVSPVAARAASAEGIDLTRVTGSGPAGRITKSDVLAVASSVAADVGGDGAAAEPVAQPMRGGAAALARYMEQSRSIPTATSFRTLTVTT